MMNGPPNDELDIRSLRLLQVLLTECSVSRTAERLGKAQPSVSSALKRLREAFGDPLLVRSGQHLVRTENGDRVLKSVGKVLGEIDAMFDIAELFNPMTCRRPGRIAGADCLAQFLLPPLIQRLRQLAPDMPVEFTAPTNGRDVLAHLECGDVDIAIGNWPAPPETLRCMPLLDADFVCLIAVDHPLAVTGSLELDDYLALSHLSLSSQGEAQLSPVDGRLTQLGHRRRVSVSVPEFGIIPSILEGTDLVFTTARPLAEHMAGAGNLRIVEAPDEFGPMHLYMLWHEQAHSSPRNQWLRHTLLSEARRLTSAGTRRMPTIPASTHLAARSA